MVENGVVLITMIFSVVKRQTEYKDSDTFLN